MTTERAHSRFGASKAKRWLHCPGSVALTADIPDKAGRAAREGSAAHYVAEQCLRHGHDAHDFVGRQLVEYPDIPCTPEMAEAVQVYVDYCRALFCDAAGKTRIVETKDGPKPAVTVWIEAPFCLLDFDSELSGHNDFAAFDPATGCLTVVDYKHGAGVVVDVEDNHQLRMYGLGALMQIPRGCTSVRITVIQPRARGETIKSADVDPMDLLAYGAELAEGAERARQPDAPFKAGDWCQFCTGKATCPAMREAAAAVIVNDFCDTASEAAITLDAVAEDHDEIGRLLALVPVARMWCKAIEAAAMETALQGGTVDGFKLVHGRGGNREWQDGDLAMRQAARLFAGDLAERDLYDRNPLSPAKLEKIAKGAGIALGDIESFLDANVTRKAPGYTLAELSDKRPAVPPPTSESDFSDTGTYDDGE